MTIPKGAVKNAKVGMRVRYGDENKNRGVITKVGREIIHIEVSWECRRNKQGYWGSNQRQGFLLKDNGEVSKFADSTGFEQDVYKTQGKCSIDEGKLTKKYGVKITEGAYNRMTSELDGEGRKDCDSCDTPDDERDCEDCHSESIDAQAFLLGAKRKVIDIAVQLDACDGCEDAPQIAPEVLANGLNVLVTTGHKAMGIAIVRSLDRHIHGNDPMINNLKSYNVWFPKSYLLLITGRKSIAWYLGGKQIYRVPLMVVKVKKVKKQGG